MHGRTIDSTADNSLDEIPAPIRGARWIALRRVTKDGQATDVSFALAKPATVYVLCTKGAAAPEWLAAAKFRKASTGAIAWRGNDLLLTPTELYSREFAAGDTVELSLGERDAMVFIKAR